MIYPTAPRGAWGLAAPASPNGVWTPVPSDHSDPARQGRTDPAVLLAHLRAEFPGFGIVADPRGHVWVAVRGRHLIIRASDGVLLRERLLLATRR
jgi:hypothetical protein